MINLKHVVSALTEHDLHLFDIPISSVEIDSRSVQPGSLFVALPGERTDGHQFIQDAFNNGASFALIDKEPTNTLNTLDLRQGFFSTDDVQVSLPLCLRVNNVLEALQSIATFWRSLHPLTTIGITGSVGKTSTKELTAALLSQKFSVLKNPGNRNNEIGLPLTLLELEPNHQVAVLEMGFYVLGEIQTLCDIAQPQVGVITNIGTVHAERAGSQEMIAKGKAELVESLPAQPEGVAILNWDDAWVRWMAEKTDAQILSYGVTEKSDLMAKDIQTHGLDGISGVLSYQGYDHPFRSPLIGAFSAYTILCATAAALTQNLDWEMITAGLMHSRLDLRLHPIKRPDGTTILDDTYNASPPSTIAALELLRELEGRRVAILGDMLELGPYEHAGHHDVGLVASTAADILILVGERARIIAATAIENGFPKQNLQWFSNTMEAAKYVSSALQSGDQVLIKGSNVMRMDRILTAVTGGE